MVQHRQGLLATIQNYHSTNLSLQANNMNQLNQAAGKETNLPHGVAFSNQWAARKGRNLPQDHSALAVPNTKEDSHNHPKLLVFKHESWSQQHESAKLGHQKRTNLPNRMLFSDHWAARKAISPILLMSYHRTSHNWVFLSGTFLHL